MAHDLYRREFLAVASCAAIAPAAIANGASKRMVAPTSATLVQGLGSGEGPKSSCRLAARPPSSLTSKACLLTIETVGECSADTQHAADLEVVYPGVGVAHLAWSASGGRYPSPITTLAPADALGRVRVRATVRQMGSGSVESTAEPVVREFVFPSMPGVHLVAIPMAANAKPPAWRRCSVRLDGGDIKSIDDPWRASGAAPGCVLLRISLRSSDLETSDHSSNTEHLHAC